MTHPLVVAPAGPAAQLTAAQLTAAQVRRGLEKLAEMGVSAGPTYELVRDRAVTLGIPVPPLRGDSSLEARREEVQDGAAQNDMGRRAVWIEMPLQGRDVVYWQLWERPLAVFPYVGVQAGKKVVDASRWQIVYLFDDEGEPLTKAIFTLAGARRIAEGLVGEGLAELQQALRTAPLRPADSAAWVEAERRKVESLPSRHHTGCFRSAGGRA